MAALGFGHRFLNGDGDAARHLGHGATILDRHAVIRVDPFSFTRPGQPFVGFEYGSQVSLAAAERLAGLPGVVALSATLVALALALVLRFMLVRGVEPGAAYLATALAAVLTGGHWLARPHLTTWVLLVVLLDRLDRPQGPSLPALFALFTLWANLHAGWIFGLALLGAYVVGGVGIALRTRPARDLRISMQRALALPVALAATFVTPYGPDLPRHVFAMVRDPFFQNITHEFARPSLDDPSSVIFVLSAVAAGVGFAVLRRRMDLQSILVIVGFTGGAFLARRNIPLAALTALPLAMVRLDPLLRRLPAPPNFRQAFAGAGRSPWPAVAMATVVWGLAFLGGRRGPTVMPTRFDPEVFPVAAVHKLQSAGRPVRLFHEFTWGGYLLYAAPELGVFIDPGIDFYGDSLTLDYLRVWDLEGDWRGTLQRWRIDAALLPTGSALADALGREPEWTEWYRDRTAVVLRRSPRSHAPDASLPRTGMREPGPNTAEGFP